MPDPTWPSRARVPGPPGRKTEDQFNELLDGIPQDTCRCGRPIIERAGDGQWVHVAPSGDTSRSCKTAAYENPEPGDEEERREWLSWPRESRSMASPGQQTG